MLSASGGGYIAIDLSVFFSMGVPVLTRLIDSCWDSLAPISGRRRTGQKVFLLPPSSGSYSPTAPLYFFCTSSLGR
jgi:hypothetical protein